MNATLTSAKKAAYQRGLFLFRADAHIENGARAPYMKVKEARFHAMTRT
jgi:hypothetical protein